MDESHAGICIHVQDPVVFSGTVRDNLDPFDTSQGDAAIWSALRQTGMADTVKNLPVRLTALWYHLLPCIALFCAVFAVLAAPKAACLSGTKHQASGNSI